MITNPQSLCELSCRIWENVSKYLSLHHDLVELLQIDGYEQMKKGCHDFLSHNALYFSLEFAESDTQDTVDTLSVGDIRIIDKLKGVLQDVNFSSNSFLLDMQTYQHLVKILTAEDSAVQSVSVHVNACGRHDKTHFFGVSDINGFNWSTLLRELETVDIQVSLTIKLGYYMYLRHIRSLLACPVSDGRCRYTTALIVEMNPRCEDAKYLHHRPFRSRLPVTPVVGKFVNLRHLVVPVLCLEDQLLTQLAQTKQREELRSLTITSHEPIAVQKIALLSLEAWTSLIRACPRLEVVCSLDDQVEGAMDAYLTHLFQPNVPLVRMEVDVFNEDNFPVLVEFWKRRLETLREVVMAMYVKNDGPSGVRRCHRNCQNLLHQVFCNTGVWPHVVLDLSTSYMVTVIYRQ